MITETGSPTDRQLLTDFVTRRNAEAFAELVRRHGPMVLGVCRQLLGNEHDAEDAFQAAFLVLARKAGTIRSPEALPNWLYGVATRLAIRNRTAVNRRRAREVPFVDSPASESEEHQREELWPLLCEEIGRLPDKYRIPFILCYLDGKTNEEAATQLNCATGTVFSRLARARERLRHRLSRQGLVVSSGLLAATLSALPREVSAAVSTQLLQATVRGAVSFVSPRANATADVSARAVQLARQQIAASNHLTTKVFVAGILVSALTGFVGGLADRRAAARADANGAPNTVLVVDENIVHFADEKTIHEQLKGTWVLYSLTNDGVPVLIQPGSIAIKFGDNQKFDIKGTYKINTRKGPMQLTITNQVPNGQRLTIPGIFDVHGDDLTISYMLPVRDNVPNTTLPTTFTPGPGNIVCRYSRAKP
jgi:RNA polymerase sigma factor (sigma-70 family)